MFILFFDRYDMVSLFFFNVVRMIRMSFNLVHVVSLFA